MSIPHIRITNAAFSYDKEILFSALNLDLPAGQWTALLGPSGVGKSSLLRMIAGITTANSYADISADNDLPVNQQIAYMAQTDLLLPWLTVLGNATLRLKLRAHTRKESAIEIKKAIALLKEVGLGKALYLYPQQLSGGMRQRVALVRTLMENKPIVLMDEPFSALDAITRYKLQALAAQLLKDKTVLFITHDPSEALRLAHTIYIMLGHPATLKPVAALTSGIPRALTDPEVIERQALLFQELAEATGELS